MSSPYNKSPGDKCSFVIWLFPLRKSIRREPFDCYRPRRNVQQFFFLSFFFLFFLGHFSHCFPSCCKQNKKIKKVLPYFLGTYNIYFTFLIRCKSFFFPTMKTNVLCQLVNVQKKKKIDVYWKYTSDRLELVNNISVTRHHWIEYDWFDVFRATASQRRRIKKCEREQKRTNTSTPKLNESKT